MRMGIGYVDSIIIYNRSVDGIMETETYYGTRFDNVRVELTQGNRIASTGNENTDACVVKVPMVAAAAAGVYKPPKVWVQLADSEKERCFTFDKEEKNFFVVVKKPLLGIDITLPVGKVASEEYAGGFYQYVSGNYGYAYQLNNVDVFELVPRFEIGGS